MASSRAATLATDDLDQLVAELSRDVLAGVTSESTARMEMYGAVFSSGLIQRTTLEWCRANSVGTHLHEDMVEAAGDFYRTKILALRNDDEADEDADPAARKKEFFALERFADGASAAGSIRQALRDHRLMSQTLLRKVTRHRRRTILASDIFDGSVDSESPMRPLLYLVPSADDTAVALTAPAGPEERGEVIVSTYEQRVAGKRGAARAEIDASTVRQMYSLPELDRPLNPRTRRQIGDWLEQSPARALRAVHVLLGLADGDSVDLAIGQIFSTFASDDLELLAEVRYASKVAALLAKDAVADRPWPGKPAAARLRHEIKLALAGAERPASFSADLVNIYLANEHEQRSAWDPDTSAASLAPADPAGYQAILREASHLPGHPLGTSAREVRDALAERLRATKESSARRKAQAA